MPPSPEQPVITASPARPIVALRGIEKAFGPVRALDDVDLDVVGGEVHAVLGENGAGKSTLMKVIYGLVRPDAGTLAVDGQPRRFDSALDARQAGVGMVHQEFALVDALTVVENLALTLTEPGQWRWHRDRVAEAAEQLAADVGLDLGDLDARVGDLPVGSRQRIEIVKALAGRARVLILDEPTAVLTPAEARQLFAVVDRLRANGTAILFITHKLAEVTALADRITVMRRGRVVARALRGELDAPALARAMVGTLPQIEPPGPPPPATAPLRLTVERLQVTARGGARALRDVTFALQAGELFGIAGVDGNGQAELFEVLTGLRRPDGGTIAIDGRPARHFEPAALLEAGVAWVPPDRQRLGIIGAMSVEDNAVLNALLLRRLSDGWLLDPAARRALAETAIERYDIRAGGLDAPAASLSGGNVQKLVVARALETEPRVLIAANPTRGLDVAAAQAVYGGLDAALARGAAVLLISTDLDEIVARAHRVAVLSDGRLSAPLARPFDSERLAALLGGTVEAA